MPQVRTLIAQDEIAQRVREMGAQIARDHADERPIIVPVLKGSFIFAADLVRAIAIDTHIDFLALRSYGSGTESSGVVQITSDLTKPVAGRDVIVVEDIVDTGLTMAYLLENLETRRPRSVKVAALLHKPARTRVPVKIDYLGFTIEDVFVVGYGLDHDEGYRGLPYIGVVEP